MPARGNHVAVESELIIRVAGLPGYPPQVFAEKPDYLPGLRDETEVLRSPQYASSGRYCGSSAESVGELRLW